MINSLEQATLKIMQITREAYTTQCDSNCQELLDYIEEQEKQLNKTKHKSDLLTNKIIDILAKKLEAIAFNKELIKAAPFLGLSVETNKILLEMLEADTDDLKKALEANDEN